MLEARGLGGERLGLLFGGMDPQKREALKAAFQADPDRHPVRVLLATDTASEGIDLQRHCSTVIHYDIPFNPNRLEQRIGRVDRYGQEHPVDVVHFVGAGWERAAPGSYVGDLEFLSRVAAKVAQERRDLGSVNPVLARAVEARMLGRPTLVDPLTVSPKTSTAVLRAEQDLREQARRLRAQLDTSVERLHVAPANVRRVVDTALALAQQPPLLHGGDGLVAPPQLRAGWEATLAGSEDPLSGQPRPLTFDAQAARGRDDVVLAHLGHPLVAQATRLLRSAVWSGREDLHRVTAVRFAAPASLALRGPVVVVMARLVVVGADGGRLHEEVVLAGRELPETGTGKRLDLDGSRYTELRGAVEAALEPDACRPAPEAAVSRLAERWEALTPRLQEDVRQRAERQRETLATDLDRQRDRQVTHTRQVFDRLRETLAAALDAPGETQLSLDGLDPAERRQVERDRQAWQQRLDTLEETRDAEVTAVQRRYEQVRGARLPLRGGAWPYRTGPPDGPTTAPHLRGRGGGAAAAGVAGAGADVGPVPHGPGRGPGVRRRPPAGARGPSGRRSGSRSRTASRARGATQAAAVRAVLCDALGWGSHARLGMDLPASLAEPVPEHGVAVRPDLAFHHVATLRRARWSLGVEQEEDEDEDEDQDDTDADDAPVATGGEWRLLGTVHPYGTHPLERSARGRAGPRRRWSASPCCCGRAGCPSAW